MAIAQIHHLGFQLAAIAQGQDHCVVHFGVAAHGAAQGHASLTIRFRFVDGVVASHHDRVEVDAQLRCHGVDAAIVGRGAGVAGRIGDAGRYLIAAFRQRGGHIHAVTTTRLHGGGQGLRVAIGIGHHQGNGTARRGIRRTGNGRGGVVGVIRRIDSDGRGGHIHTAIVGRGAGVAGRIGDAGRYLIAAFRQRGGHIHAVTTTRLHGGSQGLLSAIGIGHHQSDCAAWNCIGSTSDGRCGVVGVVRRIDSDGRGGHIHAAIVGCRSCIPRRIGDTGSDGIRALSQGGDHIHCEGTAGCDDSGQGLLITVCIGDQQGDDAANRSICGSGQGRSGVIGIVWRNDGNGGRSQVKCLIFANSTKR